MGGGLAEAQGRSEGQLGEGGGFSGPKGWEEKRRRKGEEVIGKSKARQGKSGS